MDVLRKVFYQQHLRVWLFQSSTLTESNAICIGGVGYILGKHTLGMHPSPQWPLGLLAHPLVFLCQAIAHVRESKVVHALLGAY